MLLTACGKKKFYQHTDSDVVNLEPISTASQNVPVLSHSSGTPEFDPIKRFSYEAFTKKVVPLTSQLDFPIPVNFTLKTDKQAESNGSCLIYEGNLSLSKLIAFYHHEMRKSGWSFKNLSTTREALLICSRKGTIVVVSLRSIHLKNRNEAKKKQLLLFFTKES